MCYKKLLRPLVLFLSHIYKLLTCIHHYLYDKNILKSHAPDVFTLCVGNCTVGGNGKTPFTRYLANEAKKQGFKPAIVLRGYKGSNKIASVVNKDSSVLQVGDEAIDHLNSLADITIIVSPKRLDGTALAKTLGCDLVILDDGLQHRSIKPHYSFLLIRPSDLSTDDILEATCDTSTLYKNEGFLPYGRLRERLSSALKRTNSIVFVTKDQDFKLNHDIYNKKTHVFNLKIKQFRNLNTQKEVSKEVIGDEVVLLSALANNESFYKSVSQYFKIFKHYKFNDHYVFNKQDVESALSHNLPIICSSKDSVKVKDLYFKERTIYYTEQCGELNPQIDFKVLLEHCTMPQ